MTNKHYACWILTLNSSNRLFHDYFRGHRPPSVVLLWTHMAAGEAPTSLLQETLMLYHVIACSPGTSYWKGGTVTLMNRVIITSPFLRLTSFTLNRTETTWGSFWCGGTVLSERRLTLMRHLVRGEKPSCPGVQLNFNLLGCLSFTVILDTGLGGTAKYHSSLLTLLTEHENLWQPPKDQAVPLMLILASLDVVRPFLLWASQLNWVYLSRPANETLGGTIKHCWIQNNQSSRSRQCYIFRHQKFRFNTRE